MSKSRMHIAVWLLVGVVAAIPARAATIQASFVDFKVDTLQYALSVSGTSFFFKEVLGPTSFSVTVGTGVPVGLATTFQAPLCCSFDGTEGIASGSIIVGGQIESATFTGIGGASSTFVAPPGVPITITIPTTITGTFAANVPNAPDISINLPGWMIVSLVPISPTQDVLAGVELTDGPEPSTLFLMMTGFMVGAFCIAKSRRNEKGRPRSPAERCNR